MLFKCLVMFYVVFETTNILWYLIMLPLFSFFLVTLYTTAWSGQSERNCEDDEICVVIEGGKSRRVGEGMWRKGGRKGDWEMGWRNTESRGETKARSAIKCPGNSNFLCVNSLHTHTHTHTHTHIHSVLEITKGRIWCHWCGKALQSTEFIGWRGGGSQTPFPTSCMKPCIKGVAKLEGKMWECCWNPRASHPLYH